MLNTNTIAGNVHFELLADQNSPVVNPAFLVKNWGDSKVRLTINGAVLEQGAHFRTGHMPHENGTDLIVWIQFESDEQVKIQLHK